MKLTGSYLDVYVENLLQPQPDRLYMSEARCREIVAACEEQKIPMTSNPVLDGPLAYAGLKFFAVSVGTTIRHEVTGDEVVIDETSVIACTSDWKVVS